jgi:hypothetical protein
MCFNKRTGGDMIKVGYERVWFPHKAIDFCRMYFCAFSNWM